MGWHRAREDGPRRPPRHRGRFRPVSGLARRGRIAFPRRLAAGRSGLVIRFARLPLRGQRWLGLETHQLPVSPVRRRPDGHLKRDDFRAGAARRQAYDGWGKMGYGEPWAGLRRWRAQSCERFRPRRPRAVAVARPDVGPGHSECRRRAGPRASVGFPRSRRWSSYRTPAPVRGCA